MDVEESKLQEELVYKPGTTIGTKFSVLHCIRIPFLMRCGFWPVIHSYEYPCSSQSFPSDKTAGVSSRTISVKNVSLVFFGLLTGSPDRLSRRTPGWTPFHLKQTLCGVTFQRAHPLPATPFQCPRSRTATLELGSRSTHLALRWPDCTLSRLRAEEYGRPVTQSIATLEPSSRTIPTLDRTLVAG